MRFSAVRLAGIDALIAEATAYGYKVLFSSAPYVSSDGPSAADHSEGIANHYFVTGDGGNIIDWQWNDGSREGATAWWPPSAAGTSRESVRASGAGSTGSTRSRGSRAA